MRDKQSLGCQTGDFDRTCNNDLKFNKHDIDKDNNIDYSAINIQSLGSLSI